MFYSTVKDLIKGTDFLSVLKYLLEEEKAGRIVLYAGTYNLDTAVERFCRDKQYEHASFYVYTKDDKKGYHIYLNKMGIGILEDDKIFKASNRYLYSKNHLSNCYFGEDDCRSGEFFEKKNNRLSLLKNGFFEAFGEILLVILSFAFGMGIISLLPSGAAEKMPVEAVIIIGMFIIAAAVGVVLLIVYYRNKKR